MPKRDFQVFVKPVGARCNLACDYCYYLDRGGAGAGGEPPRISEELLERYIAQHVAAAPDPVIRFSWHGGEPTLLGLDTFRTIAGLQRKYRPPGQTIINGMQTNGTLLTDDWGQFLAEERFSVGLSLDGPRELHDRHRRARDGRPSFDAALRGHEILRRHGVPTDILCVVSAHNAPHPADVYGFFKTLGATAVSFLPLVERRADKPGEALPDSVSAEAWGNFLCDVFDEWEASDIGRMEIQIIEEAVRAAFGREHSLCLFRPICGDVPVLETNGDVYSCDHFVDDGHRLGNIGEATLRAMLESPAQRAFGQAKRTTLPRMCRECDVLTQCHGECPKNRFLRTPDGEPGLNWLCAGYRRFFRHIRPFVEEVSAERRRQDSEARALASKEDPGRPPGRNDPCPCGSGRKYKKCCGSA